MSPDASVPSRRNRFLWFLIAAALLGTASLAVFLLLRLAPTPRQVVTITQIPQVDTTLLAYRRSPLLVEGSGLVRPRAEILVSAQVNGQVVRLHPSLVSGGYIPRDEVMVEIDSRVYRAALDEARAARAALVSNLDYLEKQVTRLQSLRDSSFVSEENLDDMISRRDQARANLARQDALIVRSELDLEHTSIRAPFSGYIQSESVDVGDIVSPGRELARFYASDGVEIVVSLTADDAAWIPDLWERHSTVPRLARVQTEYGGRRYEWPAELTRVESDLDRNTRTIDVVLTVADPSQPGEPTGEAPGVVEVSAPPLLVGMYADVVIEGLSLPGHFILPVSAVHDGAIWVVDSESRLRITPVDIVRQEGNTYVLLAPSLPEGTAIITSAIALVSDGMSVVTLEQAR